MEVDNSQFKEINVLILGETGVGKSTWINGLANYIQFENLEAAARHESLLTIIPSSFSFTDDEGEIVKIKVGEENDNEKFTTGQSATQTPVTYLLPIPEKNCLVKLIDTPGIGDTRGVEQDKKNFESILSHISNFDELHAILILLKPNSARLTVMFEFCIKELLVYLHKDAARNIIFCYTNTRGTFYKPGDTLPTLKEMVNKSKLELNTKKNFCFDNEAFRFLACLKNGIEFEEHEKAAFSQSWDIATKTTNRLFDYMMTLEPHQIESTMSLNNARRIIGLMSRPMSEMTENIVKNIETLEDHKKKIRDLDSKANDLQKNLRVNITTLEYRKLGYPRTVCTNGECIETIFDEEAKESKKIYRQQCHPHCYLTGIEVNNVGFEGLKGCAAMWGDGFCEPCGHSYKEHKHMTYDLVRVPLEKLNAEVNAKLNANRGEKKTKESRIKTLDDAIKTMKEDKNNLFETSAKFGSFLKQNAILPYNDAILEYFKISINQETSKAMDDQDAERISNLKQMTKDYEEKIKSIEDAMKSGTKDPVTPEEINKLRNDLFRMKNFGPDLRNIFDQIEQNKQKAARVSHVLIGPIETVARWTRRGTKAMKKMYGKYIAGHQEEEDYEEVPDFEEEFEDDNSGEEVDRRGNKRQKIFF